MNHQKGVCRICGCTDDHACHLLSGWPCSWVNNTHTLCSNPDCIRKAKAAAARKRKGRNK